MYHVFLNSSIRVCHEGRPIFRMAYFWNSSNLEKPFWLDCFYELLM